MKIERTEGPPIIIGKRVAIGQIVGAACAWGFWLAEAIWHVEVPAAMVVQATTLLIGLVQIYVVNKYGVSTINDDTT